MVTVQVEAGSSSSHTAADTQGLRELDLRARPPRSPLLTRVFPLLGL